MFLQKGVQKLRKSNTQEKGKKTDIVLLRFVVTVNMTTFTVITLLLKKNNIFVQHTLLEFIFLVIMHLFHCGEERVKYANKKKRRENILHDDALYTVL